MKKLLAIALLLCAAKSYANEQQFPGGSWSQDCINPRYEFTGNSKQAFVADCLHKDNKRKPARYKIKGDGYGSGINLKFENGKLKKKQKLKNYFK